MKWSNKLFTCNFFLAFLMVLCLSFLLMACGEQETSPPGESVFTLPPDSFGLAANSTLLDPGIYSESEAIISPWHLEFALAQGEAIRIIDVRNEDSYSLGHIPGAVRIDRSDIEKKEGELKGIMLGKAEMELLLGKLGVKPNSRIVIYDENNNVNAARVWWLLQYYGHPNVSLINGGIQGWKAAKMPIETNVTVVVPENYQFTGTGNMEIFADKETVNFNMKHQGWGLMDARKEAEYFGKIQKPGAFRSGHIPGAILLDYRSFVNAEEGEDRSFKSIDELRKIVNHADFDPEDPIIVYCHSGYRSSLTTFVLKELLNFNRVKNYDGSWVEWSYDKELLIEKLDEVSGKQRYIYD